MNLLLQVFLMIHSLCHQMKEQLEEDEDDEDPWKQLMMEKRMKKNHQQMSNKLQDEELQRKNHEEDDYEESSKDPEGINQMKAREFDGRLVFSSSGSSRTEEEDTLNHPELILRHDEKPEDKRLFQDLDEEDDYVISGCSSIRMKETATGNHHRQDDDEEEEMKIDENDGEDHHHHPHHDQLEYNDDVNMEEDGDDVVMRRSTTPDELMKALYSSLQSMIPESAVTPEAFALNLSNVSLIILSSNHG